MVTVVVTNDLSIRFFFPEIIHPLNCIDHPDAKSTPPYKLQSNLSLKALIYSDVVVVMDVVYGYLR